MAHLWTEVDGQWQARPLAPGERLVFPLPAASSSQAQFLVSAQLLCTKPANAREAWALVVRPGLVRVNGQALWLGLRVLRDRDEVQLPGQGSVFFSTESLAKVEGFPGATKPVFCPRCRDKIETGLAVKCPACGVWHHQLPDRPCWTYSETCALCPQPSALSTGFQWTPERL